MEFEYKQGERSYLDQRVFADSDPVEVDDVPSNIDGMAVYIVPLLDNLKHCKGSRPWGK